MCGRVLSGRLPHPPSRGGEELERATVIAYFVGADQKTPANLKFHLWGRLKLHLG